VSFAVYKSDHINLFLSPDKPPSRGSQSHRSTKEEATGTQQVETASDGHSWMLDNVAEVVHLATQINLTSQTAEALGKLDEGDKNSLQVQ
jgi:hypothetical protein